MDTVNVLVVSRSSLHDGFLDEIASVSPRVSAKDGMEQFVSELRRKGSQSPLVNRLENEVRQGTRCSLIQPKTFRPDILYCFK